MLRWRRAAVVAGLLCAIVSALSPLPAMADATSDKAEFLLAPLPAEGWTVGSKSVKSKALAMEYVPKGQTVENWTEMLTVNIWRDAPFTYEGILEQMKRRLEETKPCRDISMQKLENREVDGYPATLYVLSCPKFNDKDAGEYTLLLNIEGKDAVYGLQRAWHGAPFAADAKPIDAEKEKEWFTYFSRVHVCDNRVEGKGCARALEELDPKTR